MACEHPILLLGECLFMRIYNCTHDLCLYVLTSVLLPAPDISQWPDQVMNVGIKANLGRYSPLSNTVHGVAVHR